MDWLNHVPNQENGPPPPVPAKKIGVMTTATMIEPALWLESVELMSGRRVNAHSVLPEDVAIGDLANHLAHTGFGFGHTSRFYSSAQFSCEVARLLPKAYRAFALLAPGGAALVGRLHQSVPCTVFVPNGEGGVDAVPIGYLHGKVVRAAAAKLGLPDAPPSDYLELMIAADERVYLALAREGIVPQLDATAEQMMASGDYMRPPWEPAAARVIWLSELQDALGHHGLTTLVYQD
jgi:hypothetical protein